MATLTKTEAYQIDASKGTFYVEFDSETGGYGTFGSETGFCYDVHCSEDEAHKQAQAMNAMAYLQRKGK